LKPVLDPQPCKLRRLRHFLNIIVSSMKNCALCQPVLETPRRSYCKSDSPLCWFLRLDRNQAESYLWHVPGGNGCE